MNLTRYTLEQAVALVYGYTDFILEDRQMLRIYGNLPTHLGDIIDDFFEVEETEE